MVCFSRSAPGSAKSAAIGSDMSIPRRLIFLWLRPALKLIIARAQLARPWVGPSIIPEKRPPLNFHPASAPRQNNAKSVIDQSTL